MEFQVEKLENFCHILLFEFNRGAKAAETARNTCAVYGDNSIGEITARKWLSRFKEDRFDISDTPRSVISSVIDEYRLNTLIHNDPRHCTRELANLTNCDHSTIVRHLYAMGKFQKSGVLVPHVLSQNYKNQRVPFMHLCLLVIHWLGNNIDHSYPVSLVVTKMVSLC